MRVTPVSIEAPGASRQIRFHQLLVGARKSWLADALAEALKTADPNTVKRQLSAYVPADVQKLLAAGGVQDEHVFPVPVVLEAKPTLIGYYRLLLGIPQKSFYGAGTGMGQFKNMTIQTVEASRSRGFLCGNGRQLGGDGAPDESGDLGA
jgi:hypothetical protein